MSFTMPWNSSPAIGTPLSQIRDVPMAHLIRDEVLAAILRGDLAAGERITEPVIAARLGVSRVPVREALRDLESTGLVESRKHSGVFVRHVSQQETAELYELRALLDAHAGRAAAACTSPTLVATLEGRLERMNDAALHKDVAAYYEANLYFHWDIICAGGNQQIRDVYRGVVQRLHLARLKNLSSDVGMLESIREHHAIVAAIAAGDAQGCAALMENHVKSAGARLALLNGNSASASPLSL
jgi:DNA-binding GntR family transcriptional regulator